MACALDAARKVGCSKQDFVDGLESMRDMLDEDLAAAKDSARGSEDE